MSHGIRVSLSYFPDTATWNSIAILQIAGILHTGTVCLFLQCLQHPPLPVISHATCRAKNSVLQDINNHVWQKGYAWLQVDHSISSPMLWACPCLWCRHTIWVALQLEGLMEGPRKSSGVVLTSDWNCGSRWGSGDGDFVEGQATQSWPVRKNKRWSSGFCFLWVNKSVIKNVWSDILYLMSHVFNFAFINYNWMNCRWN